MLSLIVRDICTISDIKLDADHADILDKIIIILYL